MATNPETAIEPNGQDEDMGDTASIPAALVDAMPEPGDTITLSVVSVDQNSGTITVAKAATPEAEEPEGSDAMAAEFDNQPRT